MLGMKLSKRDKGVFANGATIANPINIVPTTANANWRSRKVGRAVTTENPNSFDRSVLDMLVTFAG
jgi:hypothetical protein